MKPKINAEARRRLEELAREWTSFRYSGYVPPEDGSAADYAEQAFNDCGAEINALLREAEPPEPTWPHGDGPIKGKPWYSTYQPEHTPSQQEALDALDRLFVYYDAEEQAAAFRLLRRFIEQAGVRKWTDVHTLCQAYEQGVGDGYAGHDRSNIYNGEQLYAYAAGQLHAKHNPKQAGAVPEGWQAVPVEPTKNMLIDGAKAARDWLSEDGQYPRSRAVYRVMLAAAPKPEGE
jgi:hypothetical protein